MAKPDKVALGEIEVRAHLNPRHQLSTEVVHEYGRRLLNGETPPPIEVCRKTNVLFHGYHRYHVWKQHAGDEWQTYRVPVIWRDDLPDPDKDSELWRALAAAANRDNGQRVTVSERRALLLKIREKYGDYEAVKLLGQLCETPESWEELIRRYEEGLRPKGNGMQEPKWTDKPETPATRPGGPPYRTGTHPIGAFRSQANLVRTYCRTLINILSRLEADDLTALGRQAVLKLYEVMLPLVRQIRRHNRTSKSR
jgi:hypothetical protein